MCLYASLVNVIVFAAYNSCVTSALAFAATLFFPYIARGIIGTPGVPDIRGMERGCRHRNEQAAIPHSERRNKTISLCVNTCRSLLSRLPARLVQPATAIRRDLRCSLKLCSHRDSLDREGPFRACENNGNIPMLVVPTCF